jgi:hypothetical protein
VSVEALAKSEPRLRLANYGAIEAGFGGFDRLTAGDPALHFADRTGVSDPGYSMQCLPFISVDQRKLAVS